jgi:adenylate cyclase
MAQSIATVVFADLVGSTALFETLGNERATETITRLTRWIADSFRANGCSTVKMLGDGVLGVFAEAPPALKTLVEMQRNHRLRLERWPVAVRTEIRMGVTSGEVVERDDDVYGDAVNTAARLSDLAGASQIWVSESTTAQVTAMMSELRFRFLGPVSLKGKAEALGVYLLSWDDSEASEMLTMAATLGQPHVIAHNTTSALQLRWQGTQKVFLPADLPLHIGRLDTAEFPVADPRVSRLHARLDYRNGAFVLTDVSSFGTWLRFAKSEESQIQLRREPCVLHGDGEASLGVPFNEASPPVVQFEVVGSAAAHPSNSAGPVGQAA